MAEGKEGMQSSGQAFGGHWAKHTPDRTGTQSADTARRAAHKARRRSGRGAGEEGLADYEAEKAEKAAREAEQQQDDISFDPSRFMAEEGKQTPWHEQNRPVKRIIKRGPYAGTSIILRRLESWGNDKYGNPAHRYETSGWHPKHGDIFNERRFDTPGEAEKHFRDAQEHLNTASKFVRYHNDDMPFESQTESVLGEEGGPYNTGGAPESANSSPAKTSAGGEPNPKDYERRDLLPKKIMAQLRKTCGDGIYGYPREELFRLAREKGLLGTEEDFEGDGDVLDERNTAAMSRFKQSFSDARHGSPLPPPRPDNTIGQKVLRARKHGEEQQAREADSTIQQMLRKRRLKRKLDGDVDEEGVDVDASQYMAEHDYADHAKKHGGKFVKYIQGNIGIYQFPTTESAHTFAGHCADKTTATPKVDGKMVFIDEPVLGENSGHIGAAGNSAGGAGLSNRPGPTEKPPVKKPPVKKLSEPVDVHDAHSSWKDFAEFQAQSSRRELGRSAGGAGLSNRPGPTEKPPVKKPPVK